MRKADIYFHGNEVGTLIEHEKNEDYQFVYHSDYNGPPISVTLPTSQNEYHFEQFPSFFEGLLPEGVNLEMLLRSKKIDRNDPFSQLIAVGEDTVGAVTVKESQQ